MNMNEYLATTLFGLEEVLVKELEMLGAASVKALNRAVSFKGDQAMFYRANYHVRTALRILRPLKSFPVRKEEEIYKGIRELPWEKYLNANSLIAVDTVLGTQRFKHSGYISQLVKDAVVDRIREGSGQRPSVDLKDPDVRIHIHLTERGCNVSLDGSGESLHKRGYRVQAHQAPLNEVLAAGMIGLSGWEPSRPFLNPMCGSGTLAIEAGMISKGLPGGYFRSDFGFQRWPDYDAALFETIRRERFLPPADNPSIRACDHAFPAIRSAQQNLASAGMLGEIKLERKSFESWDTGAKKGILIMNPPYGERMEEADLNGMYRSIGNVLKQKYPGFEAWILSGNAGALKHVGLQTSGRLVLFNGPIQCKYHKYSLYEGSKKAK